MASDQRRSSWPWRKLKRITSPSAKAAAGKSTFRAAYDPSLLTTSPASSFQASAESARFLDNMSQEATTSAFVEDGHLLEANVLREQAEESLSALKQELSNVMREVMAKEALVKQHQKVADEAISGWEKAEKDALSLKKDLEVAAQQRVALEDRVTHLDGALKECMRQVRHVRDEQEVKLQETISCKTREWEQVKAELEAKQADLQRRLLESDAQNTAMVKSLQERARKILEANDANTRVETELKVLQVKLGSSEKDISALRYELQLLSKELEIRNEEVAFCKKSADIAHKQHLDNVQKVAKLEADCQRLRSLLKKKLPGPAAIAQMRKEVECLPQREHTSASTEFKRMPNRSYASSTIAFTNSHQRGIASSSNRDADMLRGRLGAMEEENKLLKEALSKRIGELQTSWLLCAKTASKLSIAEDQLESLQGTPRKPRINGSDFTFSMAREPSIASISDGYGGNEFEEEEEASCAESWASALIGELAHFRKEKITAKETIKEVTEYYKTSESSSSHEKGCAQALQSNEAVLNQEECHINPPSSDSTKMQPASAIGNPSACRDSQLQVLSLLCEDLDHKLMVIEERLRIEQDQSSNEELSSTGNIEKESVMCLVDGAHQKVSELERAIQGLGSMSVQSNPDHVASGRNIAAAIHMLGCESGPDVKLPTPCNSSTMQEMDPSLTLRLNSEHNVAVADSYTSLVCEGDESGEVAATIQTPTTHIMALPTAVVGEEGASKMGPLIAERDQNAGNSVTEDKHELGASSPGSSLGFVLCKLIALVEMLPGCATLDADCSRGKTDEQWEEAKRELVACKERILVGQSSVLEFLVRVSVVLGRACQAGAGGAGELEGLLQSMEKGDVAQAGGVLAPRGREGDSNKGGEVVEADVAEELSELRRRLEEVAREKEKMGEEGEALRAERAQLREEVARHKELQRDSQARCEELQQKMRGFEVQQPCSAVKVPHSELPKCAQERELVEAQEKLAACERTIQVLGQQLHSLSSLKQPLDAHSPLPRHHPGRHRYPHHADVDTTSDSQIFTTAVAHADDVDQPPPPPSPRSGRKLPCHGVSGPQIADQSRPVHVGHSQQMKAHRQRYVDVVDASSWQQEEYSSPLSAKRSPARSAVQYVQQAPGRRANFVRTSLLTQSLDAVSCGTVQTKPPTASAAGLGRLFSRSYRHK